jgi:DNA-binding Lrp family transcriptional regulator
MSRAEVATPSPSPIGAALPSLPRTMRAGHARVRPPRTSASTEAGEPLEFAILREWSSEDLAGMGVDPRKSPETIAKRLRVSPATVRRHLSMWRARGFLLGYDVIPHPGLLGGRYAARVLNFLDPIAQERAIESLSLIDGMIQISPARTMALAVYFVDSESQAERRLRQLRSIDGTTEIGPELSFNLLPCSRRMSRTDWRLALALRRNPDSSMAELAGAVGQSTRTTSRRYDSLLDEGALMFDPILEFSRFYQTLAVLIASVEPPELRDRVEREIRALHPQSIHSWGPTLPSPEGGSATVFLLVSAPTAAELDELSGRVAHLPEVSRVEIWYGRTTLPVRPWLTERIEALLKSGNLGA